MATTKCHLPPGNPNFPQYGAHDQPTALVSDLEVELDVNAGAIVVSFVDRDASHISHYGISLPTARLLSRLLEKRIDDYLDSCPSQLE